MYGWSIVMICCFVVAIVAFILMNKVKPGSGWELCFVIFAFIAGVMTFVSGLAVVCQHFDHNRNTIYLQEQQAIFQNAFEQSNGTIEVALLHKVVDANREIAKIKISKEIYGNFSYYYNVPDSLLVLIELKTK